MQTHALILAFPICFSACAPAPPEIVFQPPDVPAELLETCPVSERRAETVRELAILATEHLNSANCANGKIEALAGALGRRGQQP